jgi:hypothetical protein
MAQEFFGQEEEICQARSLSAESGQVNCRHLILSGSKH